MFSTIVAGTDGSHSARKAVEVAADLADRLAAKLHLVTVVPGQGGVGLFLAGPAAADVSKDSAVLEAAAEQMLRDLANELALSQPTLDVTTHVRIGSAPDRLIEVAEQVHAECIVVGNRGMAGARRVLGSVPNSVSHGAPCHILIVNTQ